MADWLMPVTAPRVRPDLRHSWRLVALCLMVGPVAAPAGHALAADALWHVARPAISGADVVAALAAGRSFDRSDVRIIGDVDLRQLRVVRVGLRCRNCVLHGRLLARDVRFDDVVDLSGSTVTGRVDLRGAVFASGLAWRGGHIGGMTSASLAVFGGVVDADRLVFGGSADFTGARFRSSASFAGADFRGPVRFDWATFGATATFTSEPVPRGQRHAEPTGCPAAQAGAFGAAARFSGVTFDSVADFRGRCFRGTAWFNGMIVHGPAAFDGGQFLREAMFNQAAVVGELSFLQATVTGTADLTGVAVGADLRFDNAILAGPVVLRYARVSGTLSFLQATVTGNADLAGVVVGSDLRFDEATLSGRLFLSPARVTGTLSFLLTIPGKNNTLQVSSSESSFGGVVLDPGDIAWVSGPGDQINMLQQVERTYRTTGQTDLANNARFAWLSESGDLGRGLAAMYNRLGYRDVLGYLVRPFYPLRALLVFLAAATIVNAIVLRRARPGRKKATLADAAEKPLPAGQSADPPADTPTNMSADPPARDRPAAVGRPCVLRRPATTGRSAGAAAARAASVTVLAVVWLRDKELPAAVRPWTTAESWTGKALIAVSLTCVANANPALHQFIESLMSIGSKP